MADYDIGFLAGVMLIDKKCFAKNRGCGWWKYFYLKVCEDTNLGGECVTRDTRAPAGFLVTQSAQRKTQSYTEFF